MSNYSLHVEFDPYYDLCPTWCVRKSYFFGLLSKVILRTERVQEANALLEELEK